MRTNITGFLSCLAECLITTVAFAQSSTNQTWAYTLLEGSYLVDDCLICGRPTILRPMRGTFNLALVEANPLFRRYAVRDINFTTQRLARFRTETFCRTARSEVRPRTEFLRLTSNCSTPVRR